MGYDINYGQYLASLKIIAQFREEATARVADYIMETNPTKDYTNYFFEFNMEIAPNKNGEVRVFAALKTDEVRADVSGHYLIVPFYVVSGGNL